MITAMPAHDQPSGKPAVHRDLKSMNIVLDRDFNAKICDFGLTQSMEKTHITRKDQEGGKEFSNIIECHCLKLSDELFIPSVDCLHIF